ncbi:MAG: TetR/AcrR family transcriptional regulator [Desulfosarcina sp.]|nr:TetR/AcrR family transcriptional regulator [Desulfobacterales bacterium]
MKKDSKHQRIVEAAARVFAHRGFARASIAAIADQAGIGKGTVYSYFRSKEDLFFEVFVWFSSRLAEKARVDAGALSGSVSERLETLNHSIMASWKSMEDIFTLAMEFWSASASSKIRSQFKTAFRESYREFRQLVAALLQEGIERGEFRKEVDSAAVAAALVGTWDALFLQAWFDPQFDPLATGRQFLQVVLKGLARV